jgi:hypothetical protein
MGNGLYLTHPTRLAIAMMVPEHKHTEILLPSFLRLLNFNLSTGQKVAKVGRKGFYKR